MIISFRLFAATLSLTAAIAFSPSAYAQVAPGTDAAFYRNDFGHSGFSDTTMPSVLSVLWQHSITGITSAKSAPALSDGILYFGAGNHVYALNESDGTLKWQYPAGATDSPDTFDSSPSVADGKVFIGSDKELIVLDAATGALRFKAPSAGAIAGSPTEVGDTIYYGSHNDLLSALDMTTGQPVWGAEFRSAGSVDESPIIADNEVIFTDRSNNIYGIRQSSGQRIWTFCPTGGVNVGSPVLSNQQLYLASGQNIITIAFRTGEIRAAPIPLPSLIVGPPTINNSGIFACTMDGDVYCLNLHGSKVWQVHPDSSVTVPMEVTDNLLYAISQNGVLYAFDVSTGNIVWEYVLQDAIVQTADRSSTTIAGLPQVSTNAACLAQDGNLYVITNDGTVTAFSSKAPDEVAPIVLDVSPAEGTTVGGTNVPLFVHVSDVGSGINPNSVSLTIDGQLMPMYFDPATRCVTVQLDKKDLFGLTKLKLPTLADGQRTATLTVSDWKGNVLTKTWSFTVDHTKDASDSGTDSSQSPDAGT